MTRILLQSLRLVGYAVMATAPVLAIWQLFRVGSLGGWSWLLFLWFAFIGMFATGAAKGADEMLSGRETVTDGSASALAVVSATYVAAFAAAIFFAFSDYPRSHSVVPFLIVLTLVVVGGLTVRNRINERRERKRQAERDAEFKAKMPATKAAFAKHFGEGTRPPVDKNPPTT